MSPTRPNDTVEGRAYNELRSLAPKKGQELAEYITVYSLEGFLARLARSQYGDEFVLKGGLLVSAFSERRPTRDIDLAAMSYSVPDHCIRMIREIASIEHDDGLSFDVDSITAEAIRTSSAYQGVRVSIEARLSTAKARFHIDVNYGDPIQPQPTWTSIPLLLGGELDVLAYITLVSEFADPIVLGEVTDMVWHPELRVWSKAM